LAVLVGGVLVLRARQAGVGLAHLALDAVDVEEELRHAGSVERALHERLQARFEGVPGQWFHAAGYVRRGVGVVNRATASGIRRP
jgi:hypothetical protein